DHEHPRGAEPLHEFDEVGGHGHSPAQGRLSLDFRQAARDNPLSLAASFAATAACHSGISSSWWPMISIPSEPGRRSTFIPVRYFDSLSKFTVTSPSRS